MLIAVIIVIPLILISKCTTKNKTESDNVQANVTSTASALNSSESQTEIADDDQETYLFLVNDNTPFYAPDENETVLFDYADGNIGGLYTGRYSKIYQGYIEIDYREDYVLVNEGYSCVIDCTNIIKLGVISQLNSMGVGYSACGVACVYMLSNSKNIVSDEFSITINCLIIQKRTVTVIKVHCLTPAEECRLRVYKSWRKMHMV